MKYIIPIVFCFIIQSCCKEYKAVKVNSLSFKLNGEEVKVGHEAWFPYSNATIQDSNKFDIFMTIPYSDGLGIKNYFYLNSIVKNFDKQIVTSIYRPLTWDSSTTELFQEQTRKFTNAVFYNSIKGADFECERFLPDTNDKVNNWVRNTKVEGDFKVVEGEFSLKLIKVATCPDRNYPDTLYLTNGKYHLNLEE